MALEIASVLVRFIQFKVIWLLSIRDMAYDPHYRIGYRRRSRQLDRLTASGL
jgi:hypothetical protein